MLGRHHGAQLFGRASLRGEQEYVEAFKKANNFRPNFISTGGWDGMHLIYEALKKTNGDRRREADRCA
jgi:ABC-type branched-subunit amino acid transport system substrate-binding protein